MIPKRKLQLVNGRLATTKLSPQLSFFECWPPLQMLKSDHRKSLKVSCNPSHKKNFCKPALLGKTILSFITPFSLLTLS